MSRRDFHRPDSLYTRDPSLRFKMSGPLEGTTSAPRLVGPALVKTIVVLAAAAIIYGSVS